MNNLLAFSRCPDCKVDILMFEGPLNITEEQIKNILSEYFNMKISLSSIENHSNLKIAKCTGQNLRADLMEILSVNSARLKDDSKQGITTKPNDLFKINENSRLVIVYYLPHISLIHVVQENGWEEEERKIPKKLFYPNLKFNTLT